MKRTLYEFCQRNGRQDLLHQWDKEKNADLTPETVAEASHDAVWWRCDQGHHWKTEVRVRTLRDSDCPYCARRLPIAGESDFATTHPDLAAQWHPTKNGELQPCDVLYGSRQKVWWNCEKGHEWQAVIFSRVSNKGNGCPVCNGKMVVAGDNDLATHFPEIAEQWCQEQNGELRPNQVSPFSNRKVSWMCDKGHIWEAVIATRTKGGRGCPYCAGYRVLVGFNDLKTLYPQVAKEWHPTMNGDLTPEMVTKGSQKKVWWQCNMGHIWKTRIDSRTSSRPTGCPVCAGKVKTERQEAYKEMETEYKVVHREDICVYCGAPVPEGRLVCWRCEHGEDFENGR